MLVPWQKNTLVGHLKDRVPLQQARLVRRTAGQQLIHRRLCQDEPKGRLLFQMHTLAESVGFEMVVVDVLLEL